MSRYQQYIQGTYLPGKWASISQFVRLERKWTCQDCQGRGWHVHHCVYGGVLYHEERHLYDASLALLCEDCHRARHGMPPRGHPEPTRAPIVVRTRGAPDASDEAREMADLDWLNGQDLTAFIPEGPLYTSMDQNEPVIEIEVIGEELARLEVEINDLCDLFRAEELAKRFGKPVRKVLEVVKRYRQRKAAAR